MENILVVDNVSKAYVPQGLKSLFDKNYREEHSNKAVCSVSLTVRAGEIYGLLGPNGAGKSTIIKMITGLIPKDSGRIEVASFDIDKNREEASKNIGAIIETPTMFKNMTALENLRYFATLGGNISEEMIQNALAVVGLKDRAHDKVQTYSLGMKQRLGIAQAIMSKPKLLVLDEPTNGLDPEWIINARELIIRLAHECNVAVLVCSHILAEMQALCDRVGIINKGELVKEIAIDELNNINIEDLTLACFNTGDAVATYNIIHEIYPKVTIKRDRVFVEIREKDIPSLTKKLVEENIDIYGIEVKKKSLEELFRTLVSSENKASGGGEDAR